MIEKWTITFCLLAAVYITLTCQCTGALLSCKKYIFYALTGIPLVYVFLRNSLTDTL